MDTPPRRAALKRHRPTRREMLLGLGAVGVAALALDATEVDRHHIVVEERTVRIRRLPAPFHGLRLAQISDFHHHSFAEDWFLQRVVDRVNALRPTIVAMTGDFITAGGNRQGPWRKALPVCTEILSHLKAPLRLCSLGNHDTIDAPTVARALRDQKLTLLYNQFEAIEVRGERIWVSGIADAYFDLPDLRRAVPEDGGKAPVILLGHEPDYADVVAGHGGVDLMLAGHSHGGQVRVPGLTPFFLPVMGRRYVRGAYQLGDMQLYVNRGVGAVHLPVRFRCPPEITLFTLQPAEA